MGVLNLNGNLSMGTVAATTERNIAAMSGEAVRADIRVTTGLATNMGASNRQVRGRIGVRRAAHLLNTIDLATSTADLRQVAVHEAIKMANLSAASISAKDRKGISVQTSGFKRM
jgi:hypothetical protein